MALDDFAPQGSSPAPAEVPQPSNPADDVDLFEFPVVEMRLESEGEPKSPPISLHDLGTAPAPAPTAAPAATAAPKPAPVTAQTPPVVKNAPRAALAKAETLAQQEQADVAQAAKLVEDLEHVLIEEPRPRRRKLAFSGTPSTTLYMLGGLILANLAGLIFLWNMSQSFQSSVKAMNEEFVRSVHTLHNESRAQAQQLASAQPVQGSAHTDTFADAAPVALDAFEKTALSLAREEIKNAEFAAARRRLARLLAVADRIEPEAREEIEAQAAFLFASTYRMQAGAAREQHP